MIDKIKAIQSLRPNAEWTMVGDELNWLDTNTTKPTDAEIDAEVRRLQTEYDAKEYQRKRAREYPSWQKQLEKIYDDGIDAWKSEMIDPIKNKYPKE
jgi:predicted phosphoribosyltransferase